MPLGPEGAAVALWFTVLVFKPNVASQTGPWQMCYKADIRGQSVYNELSRLKQKFILHQEGQVAGMTAIDRWNLAQRDHIKLNLDNKIMLTLRYAMSTNEWCIEGVGLLVAT